MDTDWKNAFSFFSELIFYVMHKFYFMFCALCPIAFVQQCYIIILNYYFQTKYIMSVSFLYYPEIDIFAFVCPSTFIFF